MEEIKKWLDENGMQYTCSEQGKNKYINIVAGKGKLVTVRKGVYNVYTLLEKKESDEYGTVFASSNKLEKIMTTLTGIIKEAPFANIERRTGTLPEQT